MQRFIIYQSNGEFHAPDAGKWFLYDTMGKREGRSMSHTYENQTHQIIKQLADCLRACVKEYEREAMQEERDLPPPLHIAKARELLS